MGLQGQPVDRHGQSPVASCFAPLANCDSDHDRRPAGDTVELGKSLHAAFLFGRLTPSLRLAPPTMSDTTPWDANRQQVAAGSPSLSRPMHPGSETGWADTVEGRLEPLVDQRRPRADITACGAESSVELIAGPVARVLG